MARSSRPRKRCRAAGWLVAAGLLLLGGLAWWFLPELLVYTRVAVQAVTEPVGPNRDIRWQHAPATPARDTDPRPNIIVILADDLGFNDISYYAGHPPQGVTPGSPTLPTPAIDAIARDGVAFTHGYAGNAVCAPSRAMLLTGRYATRFGFEFTPTPGGMARVAGMLERRYPQPLPTRVDEVALAQLPPFDDLGLPAAEITIAETLRDAGYHTVHIGKWHLGRKAGMRPEHQGFDESLLMDSGLYLPVDHPDVVNARQPFDPIDRFLWPTMRYSASFNGSDRFAPRGYLTDYYTEEAVKVIEANRQRPFFLYLAHWGVHSPLQALRADYDALAHIPDHRQRVYAAMVRALDRSVATIGEALRANGLEDNTLVVFTSDNGGAGYLGLPAINAPYRGWKLTLFEGGTHVPFLLKWPKRLAGGQVFDSPVSHLDLFATATAAAGAPLPRDRVIDGRDLLPFLSGELAGPVHHALFWREGYYRAVLQDGWKLQVSEKPHRAWLHHLATDPLERVDLAASRPEKVTELRRAMAAEFAGHVAPAWPSVVELPVRVDKTLDQAWEPGDEYVYWPN